MSKKNKILSFKAESYTGSGQTNESHGVISKIINECLQQIRTLFSDPKYLSLHDFQKLLSLLSKSPDLRRGDKFSAVFELEKVDEFLKTLRFENNHDSLASLDEENLLVNHKRAKELRAAASDIKEIFRKVINESLFYEDFQNEIDKSTNPVACRDVLTLLSEGSKTVKTHSGSIDLIADGELLKTLPSKRPHRITVSVCGGFSDTDKVASVELLEVAGNDLGLLKKGAMYKLAANKPEFRMPLLEAQRFETTIEIEVRISHVPIFPNFKTLPNLTLVDIVSKHKAVHKQPEQMKLLS